MSFNVLLQLVSIICRIAVMAFVATRFRNMKYGFHVAFVRGLIAVIVFVATRFKNMKYGFDITFGRYPLQQDLRPINWIMDNMLYVYLLIFEVAQFYLVEGMLHQFAINQVEGKSWEFFVASPLTSISTMLILREYFNKESAYGRTKRAKNK